MVTPLIQYYFLYNTSNNIGKKFITQFQMLRNNLYEFVLAIPVRDLSGAILVLLFNLKRRMETSLNSQNSIVYKHIVSANCYMGSYKYRLFVKIKTATIFDSMQQLTFKASKTFFLFHLWLCKKRVPHIFSLTPARALFRTLAHGNSKNKI